MKSTLALLTLTAAMAPAAGQVKEIEVNQAIGRQFQGALNFVAGKQTVVRALLDEAAAIDPATTSLLIERDGRRVTQLAPRYYEGPVATVEFLCPSREECGAWAPGDYLFTATVNGAKLSTEGRRLTFKTRQPLRILVRPVRANYGGRIVSVQGDRWKRAVDYVQATYPVATDGLQWDIKDEFDGAEADLETDTGRAALWQGLTDLLPQQCAANRQAAGCYDLIVGFIEERPNGNLQGYTYGAPSNIVVASDADMEATVAHEIAHIYGAGDTYEGGSLNCPVNPSPDGFAGKDFNNPENTTVCSAGKRTFTGASATFVGADEARAYEVGGRGALGDYACFMGSGGKPSDFWVSPEVYGRLFAELDPEKFKAQRPFKAAGAPERLLHFSGFLTKAGQIRKEPWYTFLSDEPVVNTQGDYTLRVLDATGATIASQRLDVKFTVNSNPPQVLDAAPFDGAVRLPDATVKLVIQDKTGKALWESEVAKSDPEVSGLTPTARELNGRQRITWSARQAGSANPKFNYVVEYSHNPTSANAEWTVLAADLTQPEYTEDFDDLPGGPQAKLRIWATDGIRAGLTESAGFAVRVKAPLLFIDDEIPASIRRGNDLILSSFVEDLQDDAIPDSKIVWTSSIDGRLGTGADIVAKGLAAGDHVITLTASNSFGASASEKVTVKVQ